MKPDLSTKELKALAKERGVDIKGLRFKKQIRKALDDAEALAAVVGTAPAPAVVETAPAPAVEPVPVPAPVVRPTPPMCRIYGFPRSGNHALAAMLKEHFYADVNTDGAVRNTGTGHWSQRKNATRFSLDGGDVQEVNFVNPYARLLGNHQPPPARGGKCLYIYRDGRDVASSLYNWPKARHIEDLRLPFGTFIRKNLDWWGSPGTQETPKRNKHLFHYWMKHLRIWRRARGSRVMLVCYEDLVSNPEAVLRDIATWLGVPAPDTSALVRPTGWNTSGKIQVSKWKAAWDEADLAFFDAVVPEGFFGRWDN